MKSPILLFFCLTMVFATVIVKAQNFQWARQGGSSISYSNNNYSHFTDDNGNIYITGDFVLSATFGNQTVSSAGNTDIFLAKYNKDGKLMWLKKAGGVNHDYSYGIVSDSKGYVYLAGYISSTGFFGAGLIAKDHQMFMAKYDSSGNINWVKKLSDYQNSNYTHIKNNKSFIINRKDELYFSGVLYGDSMRFGSITLPSTRVGNGQYSYLKYENFLAKIDTTATVVWAKPLVKQAQNNYANNTAIASDNDNNLFISGWFIEDFQIGSYKFTSTFKKKDINGILRNYGGGFFIASLDADGNLIWVRQNDGNSQNNSFEFNGGSIYYVSNGRVTLDYDKNVYICGSFRDTLIFSTTKILVSAGGTDGFIAKYDSTGKFIWAKQIGGQFGDVVTELAFKNRNELCAVGAYFYQANFDNISLSNDNGSNSFIALYDTSGTLKNIKEPSALWGTSAAVSIKKDITGNFYISGSFIGKIAFDQDTLFTDNYAGVFISKFGVCNAPPKLTASGTTNICAGDSVVFSVANFYNNYRWYNSGVEIKGAKKNKITAKNSGTYRVVIDSGECSGVSNPITLNVSKKANLGEDKTFCLGGSVILNPGEFTSFQWSDGSTGKTLFVNKTGTYYVSATNAMGCVSTDTVKITVNAPPKPEISTSSKNTICPGDTITLRLTLPYANYQWFKNGQIMFGLTVDNIKVTAAGNYSVKVANSDGCQNTDTIAIKTTQLHQPQIVASGPLAFCEGEEVTLSVSSGYKKYTWLKDDKSIPNQNDNFLKTKEKGKYTVLLDSNGCQTTSQPVTINVYPKPEINLPDSLLICDGTSTDLDAGNGFASYKWKTGETSQKITVNKSGLYIVSVENAFGCSVTDSVIVNIRKSSADIILRNDTLFASPAVQYQWHYEGIAIEGATGNYYVPLFDGNYSVVIGDEFGCTSQTESTYYESNKWKKGEPLELKIYPNPTYDKVNIQFYFGPNVEIDARIELYDALGKKLLENQSHLNSNFSQKITLDLSPIADGIYFMKIHLNDLSTTKKIVKVTK